MTEAVAVADRIHALTADPSKGLGNFLADVDRLRVQHGDNVVIAALATELMTASARLACLPADAGEECSCLILQAHPTPASTQPA